MLTQKSLTQHLHDAVAALHAAKTALTGIQTLELERLKAVGILDEARQAIEDAEATLSWIKSDLIK